MATPYHVDEQTNELEALRSIFFEEFSEPEPQTQPPSFNLQVKMAGYHTLAGPQPEYSLHVTYSPEYPDSLPQLRIDAPVGLDEDETAQLHSLVVESAETMLGMAMVFGVQAGAVEALETFVRARDDRNEADRERRLAEEEAAEKAKYAGTKVTMDSFTQWRTKFLKELAEQERVRVLQAAGGANSAGAKALMRAEANKGKITGRALFEKDKTLAKSDMGLMADGDVTVDASQFEGLEDDADEEEEENAVLAGFRDDDD